MSESKEIQLGSTITCPNCNQLLKPKEGDCCVFCSYGDIPCPPIQEAKINPNTGISGCCS